VTATDPHGYRPVVAVGALACSACWCQVLFTFEPNGDVTARVIHQARCARIPASPADAYDPFPPPGIASVLHRGPYRTAPRRAGGDR
jgi:hypothetical protein